MVDYAREMPVRSRSAVTALTESMRAAALDEAKTEFVEAFDESPIGMALLSPTGAFLKVNRELCRIVGFEAVELQRMTFREITHPHDLGVDVEQVQQALDGGLRSYLFEKRYIHKYGRPVWVHLSVSLVRDAARQPLYFVSQIRDITAAKEAEAAKGYR